MREKMILHVMLEQEDKAMGGTSRRMASAEEGIRITVRLWRSSHPNTSRQVLLSSVRFNTCRISS